MIYEAIINVNQLCVNILFNDIPAIQNIIDAAKIVFQTDDHVARGLEKLLNNVTPEDKQLFEHGETIHLADNGTTVGSMYLQTRTLFDILV